MLFRHVLWQLLSERCCVWRVVSERGSSGGGSSGGPVGGGHAPSGAGRPGTGDAAGEATGGGAAGGGAAIKRTGSAASDATSGGAWRGRIVEEEEPPAASPPAPATMPKPTPAARTPSKPPLETVKPRSMDGARGSEKAVRWSGAGASAGAGGGKPTVLIVDDELTNQKIVRLCPPPVCLPNPFTDLLRFCSSTSLPWPPVTCSFFGATCSIARGG
eukprot:136631-Rhodomonas_salina.1